MGMMILLGFCFWINYGEMAFIFRMAPHHGLGSTGTACLGLYLCDYWGWRISYNLIFFFGTFAFIAVLLLAWRFRPEIHSRFLGERELFAFRLGAGLYVGAFALGSNIDYRLIVLGFCLPFLFQLLWSPDAVQRWALWALVGILLYAYWPVATAISPRMAEFVKQLMTWSLVVCLMGLVFGTLMEPGAKKKVPLPRDPA
jgi:MFS family permease